MNKGLIHSNGDIIYFLNSGDSLYSNEIIKKVVDKFSDSSIIGVYGNVEVLSDYRKKIRGCKVTFNSLLYRRICHQALFVRKSLFNEFGMFSTSLKFSADHEFIVKSIKKYRDRFLYLDETIAKYRQGGMSCKLMERTKIEDLKIISANYNWIQFLFGAAVCAVIILKYKIPQILKLEKYAY